MHANLICLSHNLMVLLQEHIEREEKVDNTAETKRKAKREFEAKKLGRPSWR